MLLKAQLGSAGYDTAFAWDAVTALTVARKEEPDLIILDLGLPGGDGWVVMERLQTLAPFAMIPIIVVSRSRPSRTPSGQQLRARTRSSRSRTRWKRCSQRCGTRSAIELARAAVGSQSSALAGF